MIKREKLPTRLLKDFFITKLPELSEEEVTVGLIDTSDEEENNVIVVMVGEECSLIKEGDNVLLPAGAQVVSSFETQEGDYIVLRERDVMGVW